VDAPDRVLLLLLTFILGVFSFGWFLLVLGVAGPRPVQLAAVLISGAATRFAWRGRALACLWCATVAFALLVLSVAPAG
jgi:hypothetical protein